MSIREFIYQNKLLPGDAIEACGSDGMMKHYAVYLGLQTNGHAFIGNLNTGVVIIEKDQLLEFTKKYSVTSIERFKGSYSDRRRIIRRALSRLGEKAYNIVFNNCEHFKNWVLYGDSNSKQVAIAGSASLVTGLALLLAGNGSGNKKLENAGKWILIVLVIIVVIALLTVAYKRSCEEKTNED